MSVLYHMRAGARTHTHTHKDFQPAIKLMIKTFKNYLFSMDKVLNTAVKFINIF